MLLTMQIVNFCLPAWQKVFSMQIFNYSYPALTLTLTLTIKTLSTLAHAG